MFNHHNTPHRFKRAIAFPFVFAAAFFVFTEIVMLLWNAVLPQLLHLAFITYWQAAGLLLLCRILFGGMPFNKGGRGGWRGGPPAHMREKLMNMTDDERAKFKEQWKQHFRDGHR